MQALGGNDGVQFLVNQEDWDFKPDFDRTLKVELKKAGARRPGSSEFSGFLVAGFM